MPSQYYQTLTAPPRFFEFQDTTDGTGFDMSQLDNCYTNTKATYQYQQLETASSNLVREMWVRWSDAYTTSTTGRQWHAWIQRVEGQAQAVIQQQHQQAQQLIAEHEATREAERKAERKAEALLRGVLTPDQLATYEKDRQFDVRGKSGTVYRLNYGIARNIRRVREDGKLGNRYCIHPGEHLPVADVLVAQKLIIEADEQLFLATANCEQLEEAA